MLSEERRGRGEAGDGRDRLPPACVQQMLDRGISRADVRHVLEVGEVIEAGHRIGKPLPTRLLLGWIDDRPLHVLVADHPDGTHYVITV